ncbi:MAG: ParB/RepB/Spo0J family partition protein [Planctomycetota bacterium]
MSKTTKRLGRGLDSLVSDLRLDREPVASRPVPSTGPLPELGRPADRSASVSVDALLPNPFQPRTAVSDPDVQSLAESLKTSGMIQAISARQVGDSLQIITGERRWRAAKVAGMTMVPVVIRDVDDQTMLEMALVENIQREDLNAVDRAKAYQRYRDHFGVTADRLAERLGEDRTTVTNYLRLLDLPQDIQGLLARGRITMGHARCIVGLADDEARHRLAKAVVSHDLSVRALEEVVRREKRGQQRSPDGSAQRAEKTANILDLEHRLSLVTGTKVTIQEGRPKGTGRIVIEYYSLDDFERIADHLGLTPE